MVIGLLFSVTSVSTAIASFRLGRLARRFSSHRLISVGFAIYVVTMIALPLAPRLGWLMPPIVLFGVANGINIPSILTMMSGLAPAQHRAAFMSVNAMVLRLGQRLGPLIAGAMINIWGLSGAYFGSAVLAMAALAVLTTALSER